MKKERGGGSKYSFDDLIYDTFMELIKKNKISTYHLTHR